MTNRVKNGKGRCLRMENKFFLVEYESGEIVKIDLPLGTRVSIGRESINGVVLNDPTVSWLHCTVIRNADGIFITDENSTNRTSVNGHVLKPHEAFPLNTGDLIRIAKSLYTFRCVPKGKTES